MSIMETLLICSSVFALLAVTFGSIEMKPSDPIGKALNQHLSRRVVGGNTPFAYLPALSLLGPVFLPETQKNLPNDLRLVQRVKPTIALQRGSVVLAWHVTGAVNHSP